MKKKALNREEVLEILKKRKPEFEVTYGVTTIGIFGSLARGEADSDSDVDVVVKMYPDLFKRICLKEELESILGKKVDVVRYRHGMNKFLKKRIDSEGFYV
jgi:predicted nucleotidyltransferase